MINGSNLPDMERYRALMDFALQQERSVGAFIPDEYRKAPLTKMEVSEKLAALYSLLAAETDDPPNQFLQGVVIE